MKSSNKTGKKWSREETILAFDLYCRMPFGKINSRNPDIIELAELIGRTPGSVGLKMSNLANHDPELKKRNVNGMSHGSKLDGEIFFEFYKDGANLSYQALLIRAKYLSKNLSDIMELGEVINIPEGKERETVVKERVGQHFFREAVLSAYDNRCCITGLKQPELLVASHIKPWKISDEHTERTNPMNGLSLNCLHDKAFDRGLITIDKDYRIIVSSKLKDTEMDTDTRDWFMGYANNQIILPGKFLPGREFIEYHNDVIFQG